MPVKASYSYLKFGVQVLAKPVGVSQGVGAPGLLVRRVCGGAASP